MSRIFWVALVVIDNAFGSDVQPPRKIEDIEVLRALAIAYVLVAHLPALLGQVGVPLTRFEQIFNLGSGVDLFFVISGFVIARSFFSEKNLETSKGQQLALFWVRRIFRIWPAAWFWLAVSLLFTAFFNRSGVFGDLRINTGDAIAAFFQYANIHLWQCNVLHAVACANGGVPTGIYWSLSLEEQFYFVFPLVALLLKGRARLLFFAAFFVVQMASVKVGLLWFIRSDGLIAGVLLALMPEAVRGRFEPTILRFPAAQIIATVILVLSLGLLSSPDAMRIWPLAASSLPIIAGLLVFAASFARGYLGSFGPLRPIVLWIGSRSYALYLCHFVAYCATQELWISVIGRFGTDLRYVVALSLTGAMLLAGFAELTYRAIEMPLRARGYALTAALQRHFGEKRRLLGRTVERA